MAGNNDFAKRKQKMSPFMAGYNGFAKARRKKSSQMAGCDGFAKPVAANFTFTNEIIHIYCYNGYYL